MSEILWITLPSNEENELKEVINLMASKNLTNLSINQLIEKLANNQAANWLTVLSQYNSIPSIHNIDASEMLVKAKKVRDKFGQRGYPQLKDREFEPRELLSLVILCYSNPNLIGPKLCRALNENDVAAIKHEILENSSYVREQRRVVPWTINLRLANYALYANDTSVRLPVEVINRVKNETIQKRLTVHIMDQRGGFDEWVNGTERVNRNKRTESEIDTYAILQSLQSSEEGVFPDENSQKARLPLIFTEVNPPDEVHSLIIREASLPSETSNEATVNSLNGVIVGGLVLFHVVSQIPVVGPIMRNIGSDLATAGKYVGNFFSKNHSVEQLEQKTAQLSPTAKS